MSLYNRSLLFSVDIGQVSKLLNEAMLFVVKDLPKNQAPLMTALIARLELRKNLLRALDFEGVMDVARADVWSGCSKELLTLQETHDLGVSVPECFSVKLQRKFASTTPPRPIKEITFAEAYELLSRICLNAEQTYGVLEYHGAIRLQV